MARAELRDITALPDGTGFVTIACGACGEEYNAWWNEAGIFGSAFDFCELCGAFTGPDWPEGKD